jgi:hypothetical protein
MKPHLCKGPIQIDGGSRVIRRKIKKKKKKTRIAGHLVLVSEI